MATELITCGKMVFFYKINVSISFYLINIVNVYIILIASNYSVTMQEVQKFF